jgi:hypothetical protein
VGLDVQCYFGPDHLADPSSPYTYQRINGWEKKAGIRASGKHGGSDIVLRQLEPFWACPDCIARLRAGVHVAQASLL